MKTSIQNRARESTSQTATPSSGPQALPRVDSERHPTVPSQLDGATRLGHQFARMQVTAQDLHPKDNGKALPDPVRTKMEQTFASDFSAVRIHLGSQPDLIGAQAFTQGRDIVFSRSSYQPDTAWGQALIGHELAHVLQQGAGRVASQPGHALPLNLDAGLEAEADHLGQQAVSSGTARHTYPALANLGQHGPTQPIQGYWGESWLKQWRASRLRNAAPSRSKHEVSKDRVQRELKQLRENKVVSGELEPIAPYAWENSTADRNAMLEQHLVKTGRSTAPDAIPQGPAQTPGGVKAIADLDSAAKERVKAQRNHNSGIDKAIEKILRGQLHRSLTGEERELQEGLKIRMIREPHRISPFAAKQPGGPNLAEREKSSKTILERMERAVNDNKQGQLGQAHFYSRHGEQTTLAQHAGRVVAGHSPDAQPGPIENNLQTNTAIGVQIPNYSETGERPPAESSRFLSNVGQLDAITEAIAQATHQQSGRIRGSTLPKHHQTTVKQDRQVTVPVFNQHQQPVLDAHGVQLTYQQTQTDTSVENRTTDLQSADRLTVGIEGHEPLGESAALDPNAAVPAVDRQSALSSADRRDRANALQQHGRIRTATVILDLDKMGGFTPQTAFPDRAARPGLSARYEGDIRTQEHTQLNQPLAPQSKHVTEERGLTPFAPKPQNKSDAKILQESLQRIPKPSELPDTPDAVLANMNPSAKEYVRLKALKLERQARRAAINRAKPQSQPTRK